MKKNQYNKSFAQRLTRWVMLVLFIMMSGMAYLIYFMVRNSMTSINAERFYSSIRSYDYNIHDVMSDVRVAVDNNLFDIEKNVNRPDQLQAIMERMVEKNPNIRSCGISFIENYFPQKGRAFCPYAWRNDSSVIEEKSVKGNITGYLNASWFQQALKADSAYWSDPFFDGSDKTTPLVAYMCPIHDPNGRVVGILGADLSLLFMTQLLSEGDKRLNEREILEDNASCSYVLAPDGTYLTHPDQKRILKGNFYGHIKDADDPGEAKKLIESLSNGKQSDNETYYEVRVNRVKSYLFFMPLKDTKWNIVVSASKINLNMHGTFVGLVMLVVVFAVLLITFLVCRIAIRRASLPLKQLAATADQVADGQFDAPLPDINSNDEIHLLRDTFENMQHSLANYIEELKQTTAAKASMESELKIAHDIQMSMVPMTYPAFPERHDIDIYGQVKPAKAVGGDLYDFFIRDEKLFFCIGDVSGKGVPASLVMAVTRSLFRNVAAYTIEPDQIMTALNDALCSNNDTGMFVTLQLGVLDLSNGLLSFSNAGHNPLLLWTDEEVSFFECDANVPAGVVDGWQFTVQQIQLKSGDGVFLYTDGLNEAEDIDLHQFDMDRIYQVAKVADKKPKSLVEAMSTAVALFVGDAEQNDDLTMLAVRYIGS